MKIFTLIYSPLLPFRAPERDTEPVFSSVFITPCSSFGQLKKVLETFCLTKIKPDCHMETEV